MNKNYFIKIRITLITLTIVFAATFGQAAVGDSLLGAPSSAADFTMNWTSNSYAPADYEGKALPTHGSEIRVAVVPTKKLAANPDKLFYRWLLDGDIAGWAGGQGKSIMRFKATKWNSNNHEVEVEILNDAGDLIYQNKIIIGIVKPEVAMKKQGDYYSLKENLTVNTGQEIKILASPLFFNIKKLSQADWKWNFADQLLSSPDEKNLNFLLLKIPAGTLIEKLIKNLSLTVADKSDQFQQASVSLEIEIK